MRGSGIKIINNNLYLKSLIINDKKIVNYENINNN